MLLDVCEHDSPLTLLLLLFCFLPNDHLRHAAVASWETASLLNLKPCKKGEQIFVQFLGIKADLFINLVERV